MGIEKMCIFIEIQKIITKVKKKVKGENERWVKTN